LESEDSVCYERSPKKVHTGGMSAPWPGFDVTVSLSFQGEVSFQDISRGVNKRVAATSFMEVELRYVETST
jgi:hypothetical protein